jgi:hypothetical protein
VNADHFCYIAIAVGFAFLGLVNYYDHPSREFWKGNPQPYECAYFHTNCYADGGKH